MAHARPSCRPDTWQAAPATDRRHFLRTGLAIVVPVAAGTTLGRAALAWPMAGRAQVEESDPIFDHINHELLKLYLGMQGLEGVKSEHVRALAANLDLMTARLVEKGYEPRLQAKLLEGLGRSGRDGFAHELFSRQVEAIAAAAEQQGIVNRVRLDLAEMGTALDLARRRGFTPLFKRTAPAVAGLAAAFDRASQRGGAVFRASGQKPGDDYFGYIEQPLPGLSCGDLKTAIHIYALAGAILGLCGNAWGGGSCALIAEVLSILYDSVCLADGAA